MAKGKYEYWLTEDGLLLLQGWARDGLTDEQISKKMSISTTTLYAWQKKYAEISESLKKGKEVVDIQVEDALFKKALSGDTTALIFWLRNRKPSSWVNAEKYIKKIDTERAKNDGDIEKLIAGLKNER